MRGNERKISRGKQAQPAVAQKVKPIRDRPEAWPLRWRCATPRRSAPGRGRNGRLSRDAANFTGLVLGCIETKFCKKIIQNMRLKALAEIYTMHSFAQL